MDIVPAVLVVADPGRETELADALAEPLPYGRVDVLLSSGGDDTIDLFEARAPRVVVLTASLEVGDAKSLIEALREMVPRERVVVVLIGDDERGPVRTALDAIDMKPDRFVSRPLSVKALRFAVQSGLENVARALGEPLQPHQQQGRSGNTGPIPTGGSGPVPAPSSGPVSAPIPRAPNPDDVRTTRPITSRGLIADSPHGLIETAAGSSPVILIGPRPTLPGTPVGILTSTELIGDEAEHSGSIDISDIDDAPPAVARTETPVRGSAGVARPRSPAGEVAQPAGGPPVGRAPTDRGVGMQHISPAGGSAPTDGAPQVPIRDPMSGPLRARWEALADSIADDDHLDDDDELELDDDDVELLDDGAPPLPPIEIAPRRKGITNPEFMPLPPVAPWRPGTTSAVREDEIQSPPREPTLILSDPPSATPPPLAPAPAIPSMTTASGAAATIADAHPSLVTPLPSLMPQPAPDPSIADRGPRERWSHPVLLSELIDRSRDSSKELLANVKDDLVRGVDDDIIVGHPRSTPPPHVLRTGQLKALEDLMEPVLPPELGEFSSPSAPLPPPSSLAANPPVRPSQAQIGRGAFPSSGTSPGFTSGAPVTDPPPTTDRFGAGRDFARQLRAKMSQMAQRLFQSDSPAQSQVDIRPRHDHHTEIDLAALGEEQALGGGVTEIESGHRPLEPRGHSTAPGSWDTQVRERGMADAGEIIRGATDAAMILARMFAQLFTGRVSFRRSSVEKVVYFDQGRPVFASSNEPGDRMGELLVREGKITASQYERCQVHVAQSGRRMGEILVDFGYLKRRELLPAVRRHVEDILYSLFGWDDGIYQITTDAIASAERIRLSRHPASLVLEGIRRKLDRTTLEKLLGPASTVIEVPDRERLGGIINAGDLAAEERGALNAFDGHADLAQVARTTGIDVADVLPFAWGLCVLGLATARRTEPDVLEESTALVGETDIVIDRERVRARWQLVTEADYFALLGVRREATAFEIRRAYQAARRDFAADCFPSDLRRELARELEDIASVLDEAFRVLRDDRLRLLYLGNLVE